MRADRRVEALAERRYLLGSAPMPHLTGARTRTCILHSTTAWLAERPVHCRSCCAPERGDVLAHKLFYLDFEVSDFRCAHALQLARGDRRLKTHPEQLHADVRDGESGVGAKLGTASHEKIMHPNASRLQCVCTHSRDDRSNAHRQPADV